MEITSSEHARKELHRYKKGNQPGWPRIILLVVLGYEAAGCLSGGGLLIAAPDGRLMDMSVDIMHGVFSDFLVPGIILFGLGILASAAFVSVLRRSRFDLVMAGLTLGGLAIWFWVEITILQELHWLHFMWGIPVAAGILVAIMMLSYQEPIVRKGLLVCGILSSLLFVAMIIFIALQYRGYNSATQTISELSAIGAPTRPLWVLPGIVYTLLMAVFGWGILQSAGRNRALRIAGILLFTFGVIGLAKPLFPMHQREVLAAGGETWIDTMHIAMSMVSSLVMMTAIGFGAMAFGKRFRIYSIATLLMLFAISALTASEAQRVAANLPTPWTGVQERIRFLGFLLWIVVLSVMLLKSEKTQDSPSDVS